MKFFESDLKTGEEYEKGLKNSGGSIQIETVVNETDGVTEIKLILNGELFPSIITVGKADTKDSDEICNDLQSEDNGRLGNQMCAYASLMVSSVEINKLVRTHSARTYSFDKFLLIAKSIKLVLCCHYNHIYSGNRRKS